MVSKKSTVLVTGGAGYLGSVLVPLLLEKGYQVKVLDLFFFGKKDLSQLKNKNLTLINLDARYYPENILEGVNVVFDLVSIASDNYSEDIGKQKVLDINLHSRVRTAALAKKRGVRRYILASSCGVYGNQNRLLDETSPTNPLNLYAETCLAAEKKVLTLADEKFNVTVFRQALLYGLSPRMRFDLVLNAMVLSLFQNKMLTIWNEGKQWRPLIHVKEASDAYIKSIKAQDSKVNRQIFNLGFTEHNFQINTLAKKILKALKVRDAKIVLKENKLSNRSYRVNCDKIKRALDFKVRHTPEGGAIEIYQALKRGFFRALEKTLTINWYKKMLNRNPSII